MMAAAASPSASRTGVSRGAGEPRGGSAGHEDGDHHHHHHPGKGSEAISPIESNAIRCIWIHSGSTPAAFGIRNRSKRSNSGTTCNTFKRFERFHGFPEPRWIPPQILHRRITLSSSERLFELHLLSQTRSDSTRHLRTDRQQQGALRFSGGWREPRERKRWGHDTKRKIKRGPRDFRGTETAGALRES